MKGKLDKIGNRNNGSVDVKRISSNSSDTDNLGRRLRSCLCCYHCWLAYRGDTGICTGINSLNLLSHL